MEVAVFKRTFEALRHPKGSGERTRLNGDPRTSEWQPSYRYCVLTGSGHSICRTRAEAVLVDQGEAGGSPAHRDP